ncbi:MAG TPA: hypothetical protein PLI05_10585 [Methanotrichaceae archaeon]|nr:hypothetical protein [Methanotrichaceae archaeon]HQI92096.1 hypothetical protein [Methanotrichaceae archaeon]HQJ29335.1 hypothetical protein [Methanotrichaceae archaeon]
MIALLIFSLIGAACAANYMYEKANIKGVGYKNVEMIISTQHGYSGAKLVEKESGSGNVIIEKTELEAERQLRGDYLWGGAYFDAQGNYYNDWRCQYPSGYNRMDYINFTKEAEFEYMPVSYQTGTYDQKWIEKLCVQNYRIGAVLTEMYTHAEHLQKKTEVKTRLYGFAWGPTDEILPEIGTNNLIPLDKACCTGVLEANLNAQVIGVAHIGWMSRDPMPSALVKGRHIEYGRSVEDLTGVFSIEKFIQLWGNSTCGAISVDWLPCM